MTGDRATQAGLVGMRDNLTQIRIGHEKLVRLHGEAGSAHDSSAGVGARLVSA